MGECKRASVLNQGCGSRRVLDLVADKWTTLVIRALNGGPTRYGALQRTIGGVSQKMLTQTLRKLEAEGLVEREVHPVVPPKVVYSLTELGRTLIPPLKALCEWAEEHRDELEAARARSTRLRVEGEAEVDQTRQARDDHRG